MKKCVTLSKWGIQRVNPGAVTSRLDAKIIVAATTTVHIQSRRSVGKEFDTSAENSATTTFPQPESRPTVSQTCRLGLSREVLARADEAASIWRLRACRPGRFIEPPEQAGAVWQENSVQPSWARFPMVSRQMAAFSGAAYPVDPPPFESRLPYPRTRDEPIRYRAEVMAPGEDFDQTGFELPAAPAAPAEATGQGLLFDDDCSQADSADAEPASWTGGAEQAGPAADWVQADARKAV